MFSLALHGNDAGEFTLSYDQAVENALLCEELLVGTGLGDLAVLEDDESIAVLECGETMGNDQGGASLHKLLQRRFPCSLQAFLIHQA